MSVELVTEARASDELPRDIEAPPHTMYRPAGVPLLDENTDRPWWFWLIPGETYRLRHDGTGWRVTAGSWLAGDIYRLATERRELADVLPTAGGPLALDPLTVYVILQAAGRWVLIPGGQATPGRLLGVSGTS